MKKLAFGLLAIFVGMGAASAVAVANPCLLIASMKPVLDTLRILAFVGAAFCIAGWAWQYIAAGEAKMDDLKKKGIGLLVGFTLLFGIGMVIQFLPSLPGLSNCGVGAW